MIALGITTVAITVIGVGRTIHAIANDGPGRAPSRVYAVANEGAGRVPSRLI